MLLDIFGMDIFEIIKQISREQIFKVAKEFIDANTWILGAVSGGEKLQIQELNQEFSKIFEK